MERHASLIRSWRTMSHGGFRKMQMICTGNFYKPYMYFRKEVY